MVIYNNANSKIEAHKLKLGLTGDVYMVANYIESLASHKVLIPTSMATTIEEAEQARIRAEQITRNYYSTQTFQDKENKYGIFTTYVRNSRR